MQLKNKDLNLRYIQSLSPNQDTRYQLSAHCSREGYNMARVSGENNTRRKGKKNVPNCRKLGKCVEDRNNPV
jgi:hypothetical protein